MTSTRSTLHLIAGFALCAATAARGTLLFSQNFDSLNPGNLNGQDGFTAMDEAQVVSGGLSYSGGAVDMPGGSQNVRITGLEPADNFVFVNTFAPQSDTVYFSVVMTWTNQGTGDFLYFALSDSEEKDPVLSNSGGIVIANFGDSGPTNAGRIGGRIRNDSFANTTQSTSQTSGSTNQETPQFVVASLSKVESTNYNTLNLWINPTSLTEGTPDHTITRDMGISGGLDTFYFFSGSQNDDDEVINIDSIRIGTTYGTVVIPEPGTLVLFGLALGALAIFRRRR